jgi:hypothetical protein
MPTLLKEDLNEILDITNSEKIKYKFFVETGTWLGETILQFVNDFDKLYTIEVSEKVYNDFNKKDYNKNKLKSILGDSAIVIESVIKELSSDTIFFLDGHYSSGATGKGIKDVPLLEELKSIYDKFNYGAILIIDDLRLFGTKIHEDWNDITRENIFSILSERVTESLEIKDRLIIKLKEKTI